MRDRKDENRLAAQNAAEAAMLPDPGPDRQCRHQYRHQHQHRRKRSSDGGISLPPAEPSPLKKAQLLRQRKESTAAIARAALGKETAGHEGGRNGQSIPAVEVRNPPSGDDTRQLALRAASEGAGDYNRSDSCSDWTRYATDPKLRSSQSLCDVPRPSWCPTSA